MRFVLAAVVALALTGCGSDESNDAASTQPVTVTETVTQTETVSEEPDVTCSTAGLRLTLPEQELPAEVADVRKRIFDAAVACDYDTLEQIALEKGAGFTFSYGGETDASDYWRRLEEEGTEKPMRALATILTMPYTRNESGSYAWPTAYSEQPTEEAWQALVDAGLYTQEQIDSFKAAGSYLGWRTAITADGDWQFFVAGD
jgi:FlaG/FlaF family flagellin (archaellin)